MQASRCSYMYSMLLSEEESKSNLNNSLKRQWLELERCLFLNSSQGRPQIQRHLSQHSYYGQKAVENLSISSDGLYDPNPAHLKAVVGQREANQLCHSWKEKKVCWGDIQYIGRAGDCLATFCCQGLLDIGGGVDLVSHLRTETSPGTTGRAFLA
jgi:hypothetical protein